MTRRNRVRALLEKEEGKEHRESVLEVVKRNKILNLSGDVICRQSKKDVMKYITVVISDDGEVVETIPSCSEMNTLKHLRSLWKMDTT